MCRQNPVSICVLQLKCYSAGRDESRAGEGVGGQVGAAGEVAVTPVYFSARWLVREGARLSSVEFGWVRLYLVRRRIRKSRVWGGMRMPKVR